MPTPPPTDISADLDLQSLLALVAAERQELEAERQRVAALGAEGLAEIGRAVVGLTVERATGRRWVLSTTENYSRFRVGDRVLLRAFLSERPVTGLLRDSASAGRRLTVELDAPARPSETSGWTLTEVDVDTTGIVRSCLEGLRRGQPGWQLFQMVARGLEPPALPGRDPGGALEEALGATRMSGDWDESQLAAMEACLAAPPLACVWGPPGTGKTQVLAVVVEALARAGRRVLITAPTHQAVNNALSTTKRMFPEREVLKVGSDARRESLDDAVETIVLRNRMREIPVSDRHASLVGMTSIALLSNLVLRKSKFRPSVVVVDEAGQLPLTQGVSLGRTGAGSTLLFGDDMQMPPVFPGNLATMPGAESVFGRARRVLPATVHRLPVTHRLNRELASVLGSTFYADGDASGLVSAPHAAEHRFVLPAPLPDGTSALVRGVLQPDRSLVWITSPTSTARDSNSWEAQRCAELLAACLEGGLAAGQIAAVTPFRRQVAAIRARLQALLGDDAEQPIVDTVERLQGLTVDFIVVSLCVADSAYQRQMCEFVLSPNRLNVALSRSRAKAIVIAPAGLVDCLREHPCAGAEDGWLERLVDAGSARM